MSLESGIYQIRGLEVMLDFTLAERYGVETRVLNQAVKRNLSRFPSDFMFRLNSWEWEEMSSQIVMTSGNKRPKKALPYAFTEQGIAMLSSVLRSETAIQVNIGIMRTFVLLRKYTEGHRELSEKLHILESKFQDVYEAVNYLFKKNEQEHEQRDRKRIGY